MPQDVFFDRSAKKLKFYTPSPALEALFESFRVKNDTVGATVLLEPAVGQTRGMSLWKLGVRITKDGKVAILFHIVDWMERSHTFIKNFDLHDRADLLSKEMHKSMQNNDWVAVEKELSVFVLYKMWNFIDYLAEINASTNVVVLCNDDIVDKAADIEMLLKNVLHYSRV